MSSRFTIPKTVANQTLIAFLRQRGHWFPNGDWQTPLAAGQLTLDGAAVSPDQQLRAGETLTYQRPAWLEPAVAREPVVLFEDGQLLAIDKPGGCPTLPTGDFYLHSLLHLVRREHPEVSPLHRLDLDTSGIVLFAKTAVARKRFARLFQERQVCKTYLALCFGDFPQALRYLALSLAPARGRIHAKYAVDPAGKPAITLTQKLATWGDMSLVQARPITGRTQQIRAHFAALGFPLVGDKTYYPDEQRYLAWVGNRDVCVHLGSWRLARTALHHQSMALDGYVIHSQMDQESEWREQLRLTQQARLDVTAIQS